MTKSTLVALDLSKHDHQIISFCKYFVADQLGCKNFTFAHVVKNLSKIDLVNQEIIDDPYESDSFENKILSYLRKKINAVFEGSNANIDINLNEGKPYRKLIQLAEDKDFQLVVLGAKKKMFGTGITAKRLAHYLNKDILIVPDGNSKNVRKILVPIDFSKNSIRAMKKAIELAWQDDLSEITALHIVDSSLGQHYLSTGIFQENDAMILQNAKNTMANFLKKLNFTDDRIKTSFVNESHLSYASSIREYVDKNDFNLLLIGATSHTRFRNILLGSTTENLLDLGVDIPLMIIR